MSNYFIREIENLKTKKELLNKKSFYIGYREGLKELLEEEKGMKAQFYRTEIDNIDNYCLKMIDKRLEDK